jgi:hypothetical protein
MDGFSDADDDELEEYSAEELLEQAQINAQALFLGTVEALSADPALVESWTRSLAATFIRGWDTEQEWEPADILFALVTNYQSFGAEVEDSDFEAEIPTVTIGNLPNLPLAEALEIAPDRMHHLFRIGEGLASRLGGSLGWTVLDSGSVRLEVSNKVDTP